MHLKATIPTALMRRVDKYLYLSTMLQSSIHQDSLASVVGPPISLQPTDIISDIENTAQTVEV